MDKSCKCPSGINDILPNCLSSVVRSSLLLKMQTNFDTSLTNPYGSVAEYDLNTLQDTSSIYKLNYQRGKQELQRDFSAENAALQQRLSLLTSFSPLPTNEKQYPNVEQEDEDTFSRKRAHFDSFKLFSSAQTLSQTFCYLSHFFPVHKQKLTFLKIFRLIYLLQVFLIPITAAATGVWW